MPSWKGILLEGGGREGKGGGGGSPGAASVTSLVSRPHSHSHDPTVALSISTTNLYMRQQPPDREYPGEGQRCLARLSQEPASAEGLLRQ